jgi:hypothetical protein
LAPYTHKDYNYLRDYSGLQLPPEDAPIISWYKFCLKEYDAFLYLREEIVFQQELGNDYFGKTILEKSVQKLFPAISSQLQPLHLDILYKVMSEYINEDRDDIEDEAHVPT